MTKNLDTLINEISFEIVKNQIVDENEINKMLGVLSNDGVYAFWVYTLKELKINAVYFYDLLFTYEKEEKPGNLIADICKFDNLMELSILKNEIETLNNNSEKNKKKEKELFKDWQIKASKNFQNLSHNLNELLFFREILEKILIYARYHAKAMGD